MPRTTRSSAAASATSSSAIQSSIINSLTSFYQLLSTFPYLPSTDILYPPATGWPTLSNNNNTTKFARKIGKTAAVIEVLRHLPYIRTDGNRTWQLAYEDTLPIAYAGLPDGTGSVVERLAGDDTSNGDDEEKTVDHDELWQLQIEPHGQKLDAHVVALTKGQLYGAWLLLDVEAGTIIEYSALGGISSSVECSEADREAGLVWKHFPPTPIEEFFKRWEKKLTSLEWMPVQERNGRPSGEILSQKKMGTMSKEPEAIRKIYKDHGWGGRNFKREECRQALSQWSKSYSKRIVEEHDRLMEEREMTPPALDPLDEISD